MVMMGRWFDAKEDAEFLGNCSREVMDEALTKLGFTVLGERMTAAFKLQAVSSPLS